MNTLILILIFAQGITYNPILIGMEGPAQSFSVDEENLGMRLVIKHVNAAGGIHGRPLVEKSYPRGSGKVADQALNNVRRLVEDDDVFLLFNFGGPGSLAVGGYAMENEVPYFFPHTALLTVDGNRYIYTSYPRYEGETAVMLRYLTEQRGAKRVAVIYAPNVYGEYFADRADELADDLGYSVVGRQPLARRPADALAQMNALRDANPDVVIMALYPEGAKKVVEAKAAIGWDVRLISTGPLTDEQYLNFEGGHAEGTIGFCHYPDPNESDVPGIIEYRALMSEYFPGHDLNRYSLYGYVFGKLVVEGLQRAGEDLNEEDFLDAMESIRDWDSGGILPPVTFSASDHHAQKAGFICELENGRFKAITDWIAP